MNAAIGAVLKTVNDILSLIPALVWAIALALASCALGWEHHEVGVALKDKATAEAARAKAVGEKDQVLAQLEQQKKEAREKLAALTAERDAVQAAALNAHRQQEIKDANDRQIIDAQAARLRALAAATPGGQLRDPNATGCRGSGPGPEGHAAADERGGPGDAAPAGGLVSAPLSGLLREQAADGDKWARLYGLARDDALTCRAAIGSAP